MLDSGVPRRLGESMYNQRRHECEEAARLLGVRALRDVEDLGSLSKLPPLIHRRARHVVTENLRVLEAISGVDGARFGVLMNASHASLGTTTRSPSRRLMCWSNCCRGGGGLRGQAHRGRLRRRLRRPGQGGDGGGRRQGSPATLTRSRAITAGCWSLFDPLYGRAYDQTR